MKKLLILALILCAALLGWWIYGFLNFVGTVQSLNEPDIHAPLLPTDGIVVLTGGSERVATGIELLQNGNGKKLFISGVHKKISMENVLKSLHVRDDLRGCCIMLGYQAGSTTGNAEETRDWLKREGYASVRLVTANYHMPRSLLVFHRTMPEITIVPHPVTPDNFKINEWWLHPGTFELLVTEYAKYLVARFGHGLAGDNDDPTPNPQTTTAPEQTPAK